MSHKKKKLLTTYLPIWFRWLLLCFCCYKRTIICAITLGVSLTTSLAYITIRKVSILFTDWLTSRSYNISAQHSLLNNFHFWWVILSVFFLSRMESGKTGTGTGIGYWKVANNTKALAFTRRRLSPNGSSENVKDELPDQILNLKKKKRCIATSSR